MKNSLRAGQRRIIPLISTILVLLAGGSSVAGPRLVCGRFRVNASHCAQEAHHMMGVQILGAPIADQFQKKGGD